VDFLVRMADGTINHYEDLSDPHGRNVEITWGYRGNLEGLTILRRKRDYFDHRGLRNEAAFEEVEWAYFKRDEWVTLRKL
jgi:hypothetical protein